MRVSTLQENLAAALDVVARVIDGRPSLPILANVYLETRDSQLRVVGTNLAQSIITTVGAKVEQDGAITLPAKTFRDLVNSLSPERVDLDLNVETNVVTVRCGTNVAHVKGLPAADFPALPQEQDESTFAVNGGVLKEAISHVAFAATKEEQRPILTGILFAMESDCLTLVGADGYRLAVRTVAVSGLPTASIVIPANMLMDLAKLIDTEEDVRITIGKRNLVTFESTGITMISQLLEGKFPDYEALLSSLTGSTDVTVYAEDLLRACKRAEIFARDNANSIKVAAIRDVDGDGETSWRMRIVGKSNERGDNEGEISVGEGHGEPAEVSFNVKYLIDPLNVTGEELVNMQMGTNLAMTLRPVGRTDVTWIVMPMSTSKG